MSTKIEVEMVVGRVFILFIQVEKGVCFITAEKSKKGNYGTGEGGGDGACLFY